MIKLYLRKQLLQFLIHFTLNSFRDYFCPNKSLNMVFISNGGSLSMPKCCTWKRDWLASEKFTSILLPLFKLISNFCSFNYSFCGIWKIMSIWNCIQLCRFNCRSIHFFFPNFLLLLHSPAMQLPRNSNSFPSLQFLLPHRNFGSLQHVIRTKTMPWQLLWNLC